MKKNENYRNEIKSYIVRAGMTMSEVVDYLADEYGWSSRDQNEDRQIIALHEVGVPDCNVFMDKQSGKDFNRPQYKKLLRKIKKTTCSISRASTVWGETMRKYWSNGGS